VATPQSDPGVFKLSCVCPTAPFAFFGATCSFALLACPNCISSYKGGARLTMYGFGLHGMASLGIGGRAVDDFTAAEWRDGSSSVEALDVLRSVQRHRADVTSVQALTFVAPALVSVRNLTLDANGTDVDQQDFSLLVNPISAYHPLSALVHLSGQSAPLRLNFSNLIFYSSSSCAAVGVWREDGAGGCLPCPTGAHWSGTQRHVSVRAHCDELMMSLAMTRLVCFLLI
jgi:hypothetical protein